jgi:hypothetical protein
MVEIWRDINVNGYEGLYKMSNLLNVKNKKGKIITPQINNKGYLVIKLCNNYKHKSCLLHRLVAMTFPDLVEWTEEAKGKPFEELDVNHKDEDTLNNNLDNLQWCTHKENTNWGTSPDRIRKKHLGIYNTVCSKPVLQYTLDGQLVAEYPSVNEAERQTGIKHSNIVKCCNGVYGYKTAGGYIWKYK